MRSWMLVSAVRPQLAYWVVAGGQVDVEKAKQAEQFPSKTPARPRKGRRLEGVSFESSEGSREEEEERGKGEGARVVAFVAFASVFSHLTLGCP